VDPLELKIDSLLGLAPYSLPQEEKNLRLLDIWRDELELAGQRHAGLRNYLEQWPVSFRDAKNAADLPFLPVALLKANPPLSLVEAQDVKRTLTSSATTGQVPSRIVLDSQTSRRMTKGVVAILQDFIGTSRRPYLVVDVPGVAGGKGELGARGAAIQGLQPFASEIKYCLRPDAAGEPMLERERLFDFAKAHSKSNVLVYGFTYMLWNHLAKPLLASGDCLDLPNVHILHSGGWKRLQHQAVDKKIFNEGLARVFGCSSERVIDFYGMVENVGVIYPDCAEGNKHAPVFGEVIVRDPLTLKPVGAGESGLIQVCSVLPTSFPGQFLLTEDLADVIALDGCPCGRRGIAFRFRGRAPKAEVRGCGNIQVERQSTSLAEMPS
jgi:Acyl-protein synthetase, LuxE